MKWTFPLNLLIDGSLLWKFLEFIFFHSTSRVDGGLPSSDGTNWPETYGPNTDLAQREVPRNCIIHNMNVCRSPKKNMNVCQQKKNWNNIWKYIKACLYVDIEARIRNWKWRAQIATFGCPQNWRLKTWFVSTTNKRP